MNNNEDFEFEYFDEYSDDLKELDKFLEFAYSEGYLDEMILQEGIGRMIKSVTGKADRLVRSADKKIDNIGDNLIDGTKKYDIPTVRKEILRGRKSVSQLIHVCIKTIALGAITPPLGLAGLITHVFRHKLLKIREKQALLQDLKTELEVVEEKIKDAEADNDRKKKYQYIRLRREIQRGIDQIRFGLRANLERNSTIRL